MNYPTIKKVLLGSVTALFLLILLVGCSSQKEVVLTYDELQLSGKPNALCENDGKIYIGIDNTLLIMANGMILSSIDFEERINAIADYADELYIGTNKGLYSLNYEGNEKEFIPLGADDEEGKVNSLDAGTDGYLWVATARYGAFRYKAGKWEPMLSTFPVTTVAHTSDGSMWFGSHVGLHRYKDRQWSRFHEEGTIGLDMPDNIIDDLYVDRDGKLWVITSQPVAIIDPTLEITEDMHAPAFDYFGENKNKVKHVTQLNSGSYILVGTKGTLLINNLPEGHHHGESREIHENTPMNADKPEAKTGLDIPEFLKNDSDMLVHADNNGMVWFISSRGIWGVSEDELLN